MYYKYDLKNGILYDKNKFIIPIIITIIACIGFNSEFQSAIKSGYADREAEFIDVLMYVLKGEKPFDPYNNEDFKFPFSWLINQLSIAFIIGKYPLSELYDNHGAFVLIKGGSRRKWVLSKYLWIVTVCIIYYLLILMTILIFCKISGFAVSLELKTSQSFAFLTASKTFTGIKLIKILLLPLFTSIALSSMQTAISLVFQSVYGFAFVLGVCGISIYSNSIWAIGNCSLLMRNEQFNYSDINTDKALILLCTIIIISFLFSIIYFDRYDILRGRREN